MGTTIVSVRAALNVFPSDLVIKPSRVEPKNRRPRSVACKAEKWQHTGKSTRTTSGHTTLFNQIITVDCVCVCVFNVPSPLSARLEGFTVSDAMSITELRGGEVRNCRGRCAGLATGAGKRGGIGRQIALDGHVRMCAC